MTTLGEINNVRHLRRFVHSHSATSPDFLFSLLSLERQSCVQKLTQGNRKLAQRAAIFFPSIRRCFVSGTDGNFPYFYRDELSASLSYLSVLVRYARHRDHLAMLRPLDTYASSASAAVPHQDREADGGDQQRRHDRDQQDHLSSSIVTGA